jgi:hypothetical protein
MNRSSVRPEQKQPRKPTTTRVENTSFCGNGGAGRSGCPGGPFGADIQSKLNSWTCWARGPERVGETHLVGPVAHLVETK